MKYKGNTIRIANLSTHHTGPVSGETSSSLNIDCDILNGASQTNPRCSTQHAGLKSWSIDGEIIFSTSQFVAFWHWLTTNETCELAFTSDKFAVSGNTIITSLSISAPIKSVVRMKFKAIGSGKPNIQYF